MVRNRFFFFVAICFVSMILLAILYHPSNPVGSVVLPILNNSLQKIIPNSDTKPLEPYTCSLRGTRWIVVTTIFYPTAAIHKFLNLSVSWNLVVIADRKTPKDWLDRLMIKTDRLVFVSVEQQEKLNFQILSHLPYGSYARKNLGYLIAIQCGGEIIFESDDDNLLETDQIIHLPKFINSEQVPWVAFHRERSPFINIYGSFGHPQIWPRGFPIDEFRNITEDGWHSVRRNQQNNMTAYIQQYLADLDPDVDALYRLAHSLSVGRIKFDREQPPIAIEPFTFSPYNTQNTVTYYEAFWGLYLPVTTNFRVCDIWRGYWVQRLLWDIGGQLIFGTATVQQVRNSHSYLEDMKDEEQLYHQSGAFGRFLAAWSSTETSLEKRISQLARDIAKAGFWNEKEFEIIDAWLADLKTVGYRFPPIVPAEKPKEIQTKRAAVCVTGLSECINEAWVPTFRDLRARLNGQIDVYLFISSSLKDGPVPIQKRLKDIRSHRDSLVTIIYEDRVVDPKIPKDCNPNFQLARYAQIPVPAYLQQLWSLNECYDLVKEFERRMNVRYQIFIRSRIDTVGKMPPTFERSAPFDINQTIIVPPHRYFPGIDDGFALGPIDLMSLYMKRWLTLQQCPPDRDFHPETYLKNYLARHTNVTVDLSISGAADAIRHAENSCH